MDDPNITMEEYVQHETKRALKNGKGYNWKTATYGKICKSPAYHEINLKNKTSLSKNDDEECNVISYNDLFHFNIISIHDSKLDTNNDVKIDIKQSLGDISIEPLPNAISMDVGMYTRGSNKLFETIHDEISKFFTAETFIKELSINIMTWNYLNNGMLMNLIKNLYVPFGIPFNPKLLYKDGTKAGSKSNLKTHL
ncbi:hypothetical protein Tco_0826919 [Tanacetum coccineum]